VRERRRKQRRTQAIKQSPQEHEQDKKKQKKLPTRQPLHMNRISDYVPGAPVFMDVKLIFINVASTRAQTVDCNLLSAASHFMIEGSVCSTISHAWEFFFPPFRKPKILISFFQFIYLFIYLFIYKSPKKKQAYLSPHSSLSLFVRKLRNFWNFFLKKISVNLNDFFQKLKKKTQENLLFWGSNFYARFK
jgi:hypothetical protein